ISGSKSSRGAALFSRPTFSSNSVANTEEAIRSISSSMCPSLVMTILLCCPRKEGTSSEGRDASFKCCK
uniref:Uncharacterized protein n=1 Tax=Coturnix japonica TaxID=93934 RepID=A0A8C2TA10_COTJA